MHEGAGATTLVVELAEAPQTPPGQLAEALLSDLGRWTQENKAFTSCRSFILSLRIADADIDGFSENRGWSAAPQAIVQFHFDDATAAMEAQQSGPGVVLPAEVLAAADSERMSAFVSDERVVFENMSDAERWAGDDPKAAPVKMIVLNWKRDDLSFDQFTDHWTRAHAPLVRELGPSMGFRRYVQSHRGVDPSAEATESDRAVGWGQSPDGGITEVWFPTHESMKHDLSSQAGLAASAIFAEDEVRFIYPERMSAFLAQETRVDLTS